MVKRKGQDPVCWRCRDAGMVPSEFPNFRDTVVIGVGLWRPHGRAEHLDGLAPEDLIKGPREPSGLGPARGTESERRRQTA
jgi:hypothetical protein